MRRFRCVCDGHTQAQLSPHHKQEPPSQRPGQPPASAGGRAGRGRPSVPRGLSQSLLPPPSSQASPLTAWGALVLDAGVAGGAGVVVGEGAGGRAEVRVQRLDGHGGIGRRHARVGLLGLQLSRRIPGQDTVLHTLNGKGGSEDSLTWRPGRSRPGSCWGLSLRCDLTLATSLSGLPPFSENISWVLPRGRFRPKPGPMAAGPQVSGKRPPQPFLAQGG